MASLFTEEDVVYLRNHGWFENATASLDFNQAITENEWLLSQLENLDEEYVSCQARVDDTKYRKEIRQSATDFKRLGKALARFNDKDYNDFVLTFYEPDLVVAKDSIARLCARAETFGQKFKGRHEPKDNAAKDAAKKVIELWTLTSGEPPTQGQGGRNNDGKKVYPAGKCFKYVLNKLTESYGESINEKGFKELLRQARTQHNSKSGI